MRETKENKIQFFTFDSISDAVKQMGKETTQLFEKECSSKDTSDYFNKFSGTESLEEASKLLEDGWSSGAKTIEQKLNVMKNTMQKVTKIKTTYDVVGHQASVPRYLQGIPTNLVNVKNIPDKQKVVTKNKNISYSSGISVETIMNESVKALAVVYKLEQSGIRVNLNVIVAISYDGTPSNGACIFKVKIKDASERMNVSKMAFAMVNPSMLRRIYFRLAETCPIDCPLYHRRRFAMNYGTPFSDSTLKQTLSRNGEYYLPAFFTKDIDKINSINDL